jgi:hypothetical protein
MLKVLVSFSSTTNKNQKTKPNLCKTESYIKTCPEKKEKWREFAPRNSQ